MNKICFKCGDEKDETEFYFKKVSDPALGRRAWCKGCQSGYNKSRGAGAKSQIIIDRQEREQIKQDKYENAKPKI